MLEPIVYVGIGFLLAGLIGLSGLPRVRGRALRLTTRRLDTAVVRSIVEVQTDKDVVRAEFATSTRRIETTVEQLENGNASELAELGINDDALGRLTLERNSQQVEIIALKIERESLNERLTTAGKEVNAERDVAPRVPTTAVPQLPLDSSDVVSPVPKQWPTLELARSDGPERDPHAEWNSPDRGIGSGREKSDFSAGCPRVEPSIHIFPRPCGVDSDQFESEGTPIGGRARRAFVRLGIAVVTVIGATVAWHYQGDDVKEMARHVRDVPIPDIRRTPLCVLA